MREATARAYVNIALLKYWGKADHDLNIPAVSSLSLTLDQLGTTVRVRPCYKAHQLSIRGLKTSGPAFNRLQSFLEQLRTFHPFDNFVSVESEATVPYAAGLASSASFYAALTRALDQAYSLNLNQAELSRMARLGSASAARSIFGGLVALAGGPISHEDAKAYPLKSSLDLAMIVASVYEGPKAISSREAMNLCARSSPFYEPFVQSSGRDFDEALSALEIGSFAQLGALMEHSTLKMHASMWATRPSINYLMPQSLAIMNHVYAIRELHGPIAFFTLDAGPNVKILCEAHERLRLVKLLEDLCPRLQIYRPGIGAHLLS